MAGFGVNRGRLPGAISDACPLTANDCDPLAEGQKPKPGITGLSKETSDGVMEQTLPCLSMVQVYDVSGSENEASEFVFDLRLIPPKPSISPAGGILDLSLIHI